MQLDLPPSLPEPDAHSASHSERMAAFIRERIRAAGGDISFAEYMHHVLYAPGLGYYAAGTTKFGEAGDFITAPEISSVFGRIVARQCAEVLAQIDGGEILEYGAGSGKLAVDILGCLAELDVLPSVYLILEVSADLRERQEEYLNQHAPDLAHLVTWLSAPPDVIHGVVVANEVLDALPVERFVRRAEGVKQLRVRANLGGFEFTELPAPERLASAVQNIESDVGERLPDGYVSEACIALPDWIAQVSGFLQEGVVLLFDYGVSRREFYARERSDGWLRCHFRHHAHDNPFILPGIQDLTAWVDFTSVAGAAVKAGFEVAGFSTQAQFLLAGGLDMEMQGFEGLSLEGQLELSRQIKTLTLPGEMGEHFKCMALRKGNSRTPSAFDFADRTHTL